MDLGSHRSHRSHRLSLWVENLTEAPLLCFLGLTQIAQISAGFPFVGGKSHGCSAPLLPKAHTDSTRFNKMIICGNLGWFVAEKSSQKNIRVIREICGFRSRIQKSYKKFGIESKNLIIFSESIPNLLPPPASLGSHRLHSYIILPRLHMIANIPCIIVHSQILPVLFYR